MENEHYQVDLIVSVDDFQNCGWKEVLEQTFGEKALGEMGVISTPGVDISELVKNARRAVSGKSPIDALKAFANLHRGARVDDSTVEEEETND